MPVSNDFHTIIRQLVTEKKYTQFSVINFEIIQNFKIHATPFCHVQSSPSKIFMKNIFAPTELTNKKFDQVISYFNRLKKIWCLVQNKYALTSSYQVLLANSLLIFFTKNLNFDSLKCPKSSSFWPILYWYSSPWKKKILNFWLSLMP